MAQIAVAWLVSKGYMPIMGLSTKEQIDQAIGAVSVYLSDKEVTYLEEPYMPKGVIGY